MPIYDRFEGGVDSRWVQSSSASVNGPTVDDRGLIVNPPTEYVSSQIVYTEDGVTDTHRWVEVEIGETLDNTGIPIGTTYVDNGYYGTLGMHVGLGTDLSDYAFQFYSAPAYASYDFYWAVGELQTGGVNFARIDDYGLPSLDSLFGAGDRILPKGARFRFEKEGDTYRALVWSPVTRQYTLLTTQTQSTITGNYPNLTWYSYEDISFYQPNADPDNGTLGFSMAAMGTYPMPLNAKYPLDALADQHKQYHEAFIDRTLNARSESFQTDFRDALASSLGLSNYNQYSINDLYKRAYEREYGISF